MQVRSFLKEYPLQTLNELIATRPNATILVPTLELYHEVRGNLTLLGSTIMVKCLIPPSSEVTYHSYKSMPFFITDGNYEGIREAEEVEDNYLRVTYYFKHISEVKDA